MTLNLINRSFPNRIIHWKKDIRTFSQISNQSIEGLQLSYKKYADHTSDKEPIVIIHGLFGSKTNWNSIAKSLNMKTKREVYCVDARNHGHSPHSTNMTYHHMAKDLEMFISDHNLSPPIVIGHSMGGRAAMCLSLTMPSVLSKLCVVDISPLYTSPSLGTMQIYLEALRKIKIPQGMNISELRKLVDKMLTPSIEDPRIRSFLITNLDSGNADSPWRVNLPVIQSNFEKEIAVFPDFSGVKFEKPTLFIAGRDSDYIKPDTTTEIQTLYPNAKFLFIENSGHWVHADQPTAFINAVVSFV